MVVQAFLYLRDGSPHYSNLENSPQVDFPTKWQFSCYNLKNTLFLAIASAPFSF